MLGSRFALLAALAVVATFALAPAAFAPTRHRDPLGDPIGMYGYTVVIDGKDEVKAAIADMPTVQRSVVKASALGTVVKNPGELEFTTITLERGFEEGSPLKSWADAVRGGEDLRKDVTVILELSDRSGREVVRWELLDCWPTSWSVDVVPLSKRKSVVIERLVLVVSSFDVLLP